MDEKTKKIVLYSGLGIIGLLVIWKLFAGKSQAASSGSTIYTTGISGNNAASIIQSEAAAQANATDAYYAEQLGIAQASDQLAYGTNTNAANVQIAQSSNNALAQIENTLSNNQLAAVNSTNAAQEQMLAEYGSTLRGLQPSPLLEALQLSSFGGQFGNSSLNTQGASTQGTGASQSLFGMLGTIFGGGGGGGLLSPFGL